MRTTRPLLALALCLAFASANIYQVDFTAITDETVNIQIKKDDLLRVTLREIPSTGYVWRFQNPFENKLGIYSVQLDDFTEQVQGANGENPVGAAGKRTIVLRGDQIGQEEFELILVRSWEFKDFVEVANSNGQILKMKDIPNAVQYRRVIITVKE